MKGSERHRLKENELSQALSGLSQRLSENRSRFGLVAGIVVVALVAAGGYWAWKARTENRAQSMLGEAIAIVQTPVEEPKPGAKPGAKSYPTIRARAEAALVKFTEVFTAYPSTDAGISARYHTAATLAMLDRPAEAATRFQEVVDRAGANSFYGRVAQLGIVESNAQAKQFDKAISAAQALVNATGDETMPRDALLMSLGRVQLAAGKKTEAKQTLDKMIADFPDSPFVEEARQMLTSSQTGTSESCKSASHKESSERPHRAAGDNSTISHPTTRRAEITARSTARSSYQLRPPGSGVPVAGIIAGSRPSTSIVMYTVSPSVRTTLSIQSASRRMLTS